MGVLITRKNGDFGAISVTDGAKMRRVEGSHIGKVFVI